MIFSKKSGNLFRAGDSYVRSDLHSSREIKGPGEPRPTKENTPVHRRRAPKSLTFGWEPFVASVKAASRKIRMLTGVALLGVLINIQPANAQSAPNDSLKAFQIGRSVRPTFSSPITYGSGKDAWYIAAGDFRRPGIKDLVIANGFFATLSLLPGNGDGTFGSSRTIFSDPEQDSVTAVAVGDFNQDGTLDIVVVTGEDDVPQIRILLGNGRGRFRQSGQASLPIGPGTFGPLERSIAVADFNADGFPDVAVTHNSISFVSVLLGDGTGQLSPRVDYSAANFPIGVIAGDFNLDGKIDLALLDQQSSIPPNQDGTTVLMFGRGDGGFDAPILHDLGLNPNPIALATADLNIDGLPDLITIYKDPNCQAGVCRFGSTLLGDGTGAFAQQDFNFNFGNRLTPSMRALGVADFNLDGRADVAIADNTLSIPPRDFVYVLPGDGTGTFSGQTMIQIGVSPVAMAVDDFNRDGKADIAVALSAAGAAVTLNTTAP